MPVGPHQGQAYGSKASTFLGPRGTGKDSVSKKPPFLAHHVAYGPPITVSPSWVCWAPNACKCPWEGVTCSGIPADPSASQASLEIGMG